MGRVLTGVNHPIETDRGCGRGPGGPWARVKTAERQMTRTETDSDPETCTGVERETGKHCHSAGNKNRVYWSFLLSISCAWIIEVMLSKHSGFQEVPGHCLFPVPLSPIFTC